MIKKTRLIEKGRIEDKLDELIRFQQELVEDLPDKEVFTKDRLSRRGIEKTIELIADVILDISLLIISKYGFEKPEDSRSSIRVLEKNGVLSKTLSQKIQDLISFRNLLVHRYGKIDDEMEFNSLNDNHQDIIFFVKEIQNFFKD